MGRALPPLPIGLHETFSTRDLPEPEEPVPSECREDQYDDDHEDEESQPDSP